MRIKVILQNYNTIHTKYQELLSAMLKEQRGERMDEEFIRNRITELRLKKGVSEYQMSMELGQNRSYIQAISSGRSMPSMKQFLNICEYFEITPLQFFDAQENNPQLIKKALDGMRKMSDDDLIIRNVTLVSSSISSVMRLASNDIAHNAVHFGIAQISVLRDCSSSAACSKGGKCLPRRSARFKIPSQAFGDKKYLSGAFSSKISDKEHAPASLCCSEILGVVHAPSEINSSASYHSGVGPSPRIRHWNRGFCERLQHSRKVTSSCG